MEPHLEQNKINFDKEPPKGEITLLKKDEDPKPVDPNKKYIYSTLSWPERKYFVMILAFLSTFSKGGEHILLIGAEPAKFLLHLMPFFPSLTWEIWNSNNYDQRIRYRRKEVWSNPFPLNLNQRYQLPKLPNIARNDRIFIISFLQDLPFNQRLIQKIEPDESLVVFNPPNIEKFKYLEGTALLQPWNDQNSNETMLIPKNNSEATWEGKRYYKQMLDFNLRTRVRYYDHSVVSEGLDHCFDCAAEVAVWKLYFLSKNQKPQNDIIGEHISELTKFLLTE